MAESHIILLPRADYFEWVKATQKYVLAFGVNITPDPPKAGGKENATVAVVPNGYPDEGDIVKWLNSRFPQTHVDAIYVESPDELTSVMNDRVTNEQRYGSLTSGILRNGDTVSFPISADRLYLFWPTDYSTIYQSFGANPEIYAKWGLPGHEGVDIRAPMSTNIYACADGEVYHVERDPDVHSYGKHVRIRHPNGYRTVYGHLSEVKVSVGQKVNAKELIGEANSTGNSTGSHLHLVLKKDGATDNGETDFRGDIIDPTPFLVYPHQEAQVMEALKVSAEVLASRATFAWTLPCLVGLNARDDGTMQEVDYTVVETAQLEAIKIFGNTPSDAINKLRKLIPNVFIMARITCDMSHTIEIPQTWAALMYGDVERLYNLGIRYFEIHQSPNLQMYGWNHLWHSGGGFGRWWMDIVLHLNDPFPEARFGFPGVSPGGQVEGQRMDAKIFLEQADETIQTADWVGVNCFWSSEMEMSLPDKGGFYEYFRELYPGKLIFITEFGNVNDLTNPSVKGNEYVKFYEGLRDKPGFGAAFSQVISSPSGYGSMRWRYEDGKITEIPYRVGRRKF